MIARLRRQLVALARRIQGRAAPTALPPDLAVVAERFFDDASLAGGAQPRAVLLVGGVCSGKTTYRRARCAADYVVLDAGEVFVALSGDARARFPGAHAASMNLVGQAIARRAIGERRHLVMELLSNWPDEVSRAIDALAGTGYRIELVELTCPPEVAVERNEARAPEDISAYFAQHHHLGWLMAAIRGSGVTGGAQGSDP